MIRFSLNGLLGRSLLIGELLFGAAATTPAAIAAECPPEHKKHNVRAAPSDKIWDGAVLVTDGIVDETIASVEIAKAPFNIDDRLFRMRTLTVEPGAVVPWHSHADRPAIMYVIKGEFTEYASNCAVAVTYKPGDVVAETPDLSHWWQNHGDETVMLVSADLLKEEEKE
jgi:quercetin dioxygenase-like cupin family protein